MKRLLLFASILCATFLLATGLYLYRSFTEANQKKQAAIPIRMIAQTGPEKRALKTDYLTQLIGDAPLEDAEKALLNSPVIKEAKIALLSPGTLLIDYSVYKPYVWLGDYENLALDHTAYPIPFAPFYTPKNMPCVILGKQDVKWHHRLNGEKITLAFELLDFLKQEIDFFSIETVDVSHINHPSLGRREIVIVLKKKGGRHFLRFNPQSFKEQWKRYRLLQLKDEQQVIDLRLEKLAYTKKIK